MPSSNDSFKKPGSIPFNWEIRPGIPKVQPLPQHGHNTISHGPNHSLKLKPPPASATGFSTRKIQSEPNAGSFRVPFSPSQRYILPSSTNIRKMCFPSPSWFKLIRRGRKKRQIEDHSKSDDDYYSDTDSFSFRSSFSTRKSSFQSPFRGVPSPFSSSFSSSFRSSPQPVKDDDTDWANAFVFF